MLESTTPPAIPAHGPCRCAPLQRRRLLAGVLGLGLPGSALLSACGGGSSGGGAPSPVAPTLVMTSNAGEEASEPFTVTFTFSAPVVINHPSGRLQLASVNCNPIMDTFTQTGASTYTVVVNPHAGMKDIAELRAAAGTFKDATGAVANTVAYEFAQAINTVGPVAAFSDNGGLFISAPVTVTMLFDSALDAPLTLNLLAVSAGTVGNLVKTSAAGANDRYEFTYTPPAATLGTVIIQLRSGTVASGGISNGSNSQWGPRGIKTS